MGQGVNTKMLQIATQTFSDPQAIDKTGNHQHPRVANTSPSAASSAADLNGKALLKACQSLLERLKHVVADEFSVGVDLIEINNGRVFYSAKNWTGTGINWCLRHSGNECA